MNDANYKSIEVSPISGAIGALITGVEQKSLFKTLYLKRYIKLFLKYKVIFFNDQSLIRNSTSIW